MTRLYRNLQRSQGNVQQIREDLKIINPNQGIGQIQRTMLMHLLINGYPSFETQQILQKLVTTQNVNEKDWAYSFPLWYVLFMKDYCEPATFVVLSELFRKGADPNKSITENWVYSFPDNIRFNRMLSTSLYKIFVRYIKNEEREISTTDLQRIQRIIDLLIENGAEMTQHDKKILQNELKSYDPSRLPSNRRELFDYIDHIVSHQTTRRRSDRQLTGGAAAGATKTSQKQQMPQHGLPRLAGTTSRLRLPATISSSPSAWLKFIQDL